MKLGKIGKQGLSKEEIKLMQEGGVIDYHKEERKFHNRPFKFRAWLFESNQMKIIQKIDIARFMKDPQRDTTMHLMQYTGIHDKEGQDVFEGDVLYENKDGKEIFYRVIYQDGSFIFTSWPDKYAPPLNFKGHLDEYFLTNLAPYQEKRLELQLIGHIYEPLATLQERAHLQNGAT